MILTFEDIEKEIARYQKERAPAELLTMGLLGEAFKTTPSVRMGIGDQLRSVAYDIACAREVGKKSKA